MLGLERTLNEVIIKRNDMILSGGRDQGCGVNNTILVFYGICEFVLFQVLSVNHLLMFAKFCPGTIYIVVIV